jgi:3-dehydroquinate synthase
LGLLESLGYELFNPYLLAENARQELLLLEGLDEFREHLGGQLAITLLHDIGVGFEVHEMNADLIRQSIDELQARHGARSARNLPFDP